MCVRQRCDHHCACDHTMVEHHILSRGAPPGNKPWRTRRSGGSMLGERYYRGRGYIKNHLPSTPTNKSWEAHPPNLIHELPSLAIRLLPRIQHLSTLAYFTSHTTSMFNQRPTTPKYTRYGVYQSLGGPCCGRGCDLGEIGLKSTRVSPMATYTSSSVRCTSPRLVTISPTRERVNPSSPN